MAAQAAAPPEPEPEPSPLELHSGMAILRRSSSLLASSLLPSLLLSAVLLLLFRYALLLGTTHLSSAADEDPTLHSLLTRLSSNTPNPNPNNPPPRHQPLFSSPFPDTNFFTSKSPLQKPTTLHNPNSNSSSYYYYSRVVATSINSSMSKPLKLTFPDSISSSSSSPFYIMNFSSEVAGSAPNRGAADFKFLDLDLDRRDAAAILYLLTLLSTAHALAIIGFVVAYSTALGIVFFAVVSSHLNRPVPAIPVFISGAALGLKKLTGFAFLRWAARDALVQFLCLWFFADVRDQARLFKLFVAAKLMPFSLSAASSPWPSTSVAGLSGFFFTWSLLDAMISVLFTVVPWVVVMDRDARRPGRDAVKEGCYLVSLMPTDAVVIKWWETIVCGSVGRTVLMAVAGKTVGGLLYAVAEVYFMVVWLTFYFAARCRDARIEGRRFGVEDLADCIDAVR